MKQAHAETLALTALTWLVAQDDLRDVFLGATGASQDDLKSGLADPGFLGSVLDFLCMDDAWVIRFCDENGGKDYTAPMIARQALPGGEQVHWT